MDDFFGNHVASTRRSTHCYYTRKQQTLHNYNTLQYSTLQCTHHNDETSTGRVSHECMPAENNGRLRPGEYMERGGEYTHVCRFIRPTECDVPLGVRLSFHHNQTTTNARGIKRHKKLVASDQSWSIPSFSRNTDHSVFVALQVSLL